jgi:hypothetical protein
MSKPRSRVAYGKEFRNPKRGAPRKNERGPDGRRTVEALVAIMVPVAPKPPKTMGRPRLYKAEIAREASCLASAAAMIARHGKILDDIRVKRAAPKPPREPKKPLTPLERRRLANARYRRRQGIPVRQPCAWTPDSGFKRSTWYWRRARGLSTLSKSFVAGLLAPMTYSIPLGTTICPSPTISISHPTLNH